MRIFSSPRFAEHTTPPGHPERPERAEIFDQVAAQHQQLGNDVIEPREATRDELARVHTPEYLAFLDSVDGKPAMIDEDTFTSPESIEIARLAAGAAIEAARYAWAESMPSVALVRPPGHHALADRAMGFCLYNNIAVAAAALRADGVERVAIVDIDVHHGNGTQAVFYRDASVLFISSHQYPYWPGSGAAHEDGEGAGKGFTINLPMAAGTRDDALLAAYRERAVPALDGFKPQVILVSAGFDAHELDPLAGLRITSEGFGQLIALLDDAAQRLCNRRIAWITEGGYHLDALRECLLQIR